jgi:signal transduction histidine kinase
MKLIKHIKWLLLMALLVIASGIAFSSAQDTAAISDLNKRASDYYNDSYPDSSQLLASHANEWINRQLNNPGADHSAEFVDWLKVQKARALNILALSIERAKPQEAIDSLHLALKLMEEMENAVEQANLLSSIGFIYDFQAQNELALAYHQKSIDLFRDVDDQQGLATELTNIGITYRNMGNYGEAMESLLESLSVFRAINDSTNVVETLLAMGFVYLFVERWDDALKVQQQALEIYRNLNDSLGIARIYNDMGAANMAAGNYRQALQQHKEALKIRLKSNEYYYTFASYYYIGDIYEELDDWENALINFKSSLEFAEKNGSRLAMIDSYNRIGEVQFKLGKYDLALENHKQAEALSMEIEDGTGRATALMKIAEIYKIRGNHTKALASLKLAEEAVPNSDFVFLEDIYFGLAKAYEQLGDYKNAFLNMELYGSIKDSVTKAENLEKVAALTNRLEFENRQALQRESQEKMIRLKQSEIDRQKLLKNFILFGMFVVLVAAVIFYIRIFEKNKLNKKLSKAFTDLKSTQTQLIHAEKMASLGELSAGIAHEIQNPLNFVNNFSEVNTELITELKEELEAGNLEEVKAIASDIAMNEEKIKHHGSRADAIVRGMLQHSRSGGDERIPTNIKTLADEYLRLSFHGMRARDKAFQSDFVTEFDESLPKLNVIPQDLGRVFLNLINNAFYAVNERRQIEGPDFKPQVRIKIERVDDKVEVRVIDNGNGIPESVAEKIFQPFFTTKPTGKGTGLGLSLSYEIITKGHGGELRMKTTPGEGTEFIIILPT